MISRQQLNNLERFDILSAHALTGYDQVPMLRGIDKLTMLKTLKKHKHSLSLIGDLSADFGDVVSQATKFNGSCVTASTVQF